LILTLTLPSATFFVQAYLLSVQR